jgi:hypothetical protein
MLTITIPRIDSPPARTRALVADRRLYLAIDEHAVVEADDARARFLLCSAGGTIHGAEVDRLGLVLDEGRITQTSTSAGKRSEPDSDKQDAPEADKQDAPEGDKSDSPDGDKQANPEGDKSGKSLRREKK